MDPIVRQKEFVQEMEMAHELGIADDWYAFRTQTFKEMAIGWLEEHGVPFFDDL